MSRFRWPCWLNVFLQIPHEYGFSPVWILMCVFRLLLYLNPLLQINVFSWYLMCLFRVDLYTKSLPQIEQGCERVCEFMWHFRLPVWLNAWSHISHGYGFSPALWDLICVFRLTFWVKPFSQILQINGFSWVWGFMWRFRLLVWLNAFLQISHEYGFSLRV